MDAQYNLNGKKALVTGGGTGIGKGCARVLLQAGANVTIVGPEDDVLRNAAGELAGDAAKGVKVDYMLCDVTREEEVQAAVEFAAKGGNLDIAVANAGTGMPGPILLLTADQWKSLCDINIVGTAMTIKYAGLVMKEHGGGSIVAISSIESQRTCRFMSPSEFVNGQVLGVCGGFSIHKGENYEHLSRMLYGDEVVDNCIKS